MHPPLEVPLSSAFQVFPCSSLSRVPLNWSAKACYLGMLWCDCACVYPLHAQSGRSDVRSACEQMRVSQAAPQRGPPPQQGDPLGHLDIGALGRLLAANQALVQQQVDVSCNAGPLLPPACGLDLACATVRSYIQIVVDAASSHESVRCHGGHPALHARRLSATFWPAILWTPPDATASLLMPIRSARMLSSSLQVGHVMVPGFQGQALNPDDKPLDPSGLMHITMPKTSRTSCSRDGISRASGVHWDEPRLQPWSSGIAMVCRRLPRHG